MHRISEGILIAATFIVKYSLVIAITVASALMDAYAKRKIIVTLKDRMFAFVFKVGFGSTIMIAASSLITSKLMLIVLTAVVTIGGEEIAVFIGINIKVFLSKLFTKLLKVLKLDTEDDETP